MVEDIDSADLDFLRESARAYLADRGDDGAIASLASMDWVGLLVDEEHGGSGWRPVECAVLAEELARARDGTPWLGSVLAAAALATAPPEVRDRWLPPLLKGAISAGFALAADTVRVIEGDTVAVLVVAGPDGLHLIDAGDVAVRWRDGDSQDTTRASWCMEIAGAPAQVIGDAHRADELVSVARVLVSADALGVLSSALERLVAYLRERVAFGAPLASFQAIQHRIVDLLVFEVKARAIVSKAARALAAGEPHVEVAAIAHAFVMASVVDAVDECMQLSGGIGFTWEYPLHHELRRASADAWLYGTVRASRSLVAQTGAW